jgi:hypothetical protein
MVPNSKFAVKNNDPTLEINVEKDVKTVYDLGYYSDSVKE